MMKEGDAWSFDADGIAPSQRLAAWGEAMRRLHLPFARPGGDGHEDDGPGNDPANDPGNDRAAAGRVLAVTSPMGFECALVTGGRQSISGRTPSAEPGLWLGLLIEGSARLVMEGAPVALSPDRLIHGATGVDARLSFDGPFRQLFIRIPEVALGTRLLAPIDARVAVLDPATAAERGLVALLRSLADSLEAGQMGDLRAVESALIELLVSALARVGGEAAKGGAAAARARQRDRICRLIETQLGDPALSVRSIARQEGVSMRYLQQFFARSGQTVSGYIKARRLERARAELVSPLHGQISISEIGFRWGFNQSAHFSRAYRERFGEAPRDTRNRARREEEGTVQA